ncbi:hypothetical protein [Nitratifractor sp.]
MRDDRIERVILAGLEIPFWDLVIFLVKFALASIPAVVILYATVVGLGVLFGSIGALFGPVIP